MKVTLDHLDLDALTLDEAVMEIASLAHARSSALISTPNLQISREVRRGWPEGVVAPSLLLPDGMPLLWASRVAGLPLTSRVAGADLFEPLCAEAAMKGLSVALIGGEQGVAHAAAEKLRDSLPTLDVKLAYCPPFGFLDDPTALSVLIDAAKSADADLTFMALGFPKQELTASILLRHEVESVYVGIGMTLSFYVGHVPRAPRSLQRLGLEWLWRLAHEPRRLARRYLLEGPGELLRLFYWALQRRLR